MRMCASAVRLTGSLHADILQQSIDAVVRRHESLRTRIVKVDGVSRQHIDAPSPFELPLVDISGIPPECVEAEAKRIARDFLDEEIDLSSESLFDARLLRLSNREHVLILVVDHMVSDAASCEIIGREVWTLYSQTMQGQPHSLPPLPVQFADYALWLSDTYDTWRKKHEGYWRERIDGVRSVKIPADFEIKPVTCPIGATAHFPLGRVLSEELREFAQHEGILLPLVALSVYVAMMTRWCREEDFLVGFVSHGRRHRPELKNMVGYLASLLLLRIKMGSHDTFVDLARKVKLEFHTACEHQDFGQLLNLFPECTPEVTFNWISNSRTLRSSDHHQKNATELKVQAFPVSSAWPLKFTPLFYDGPAGVGFTVHYRPDFLEGSTIQWFGRNFRLLAAEFVRCPSRCVASVSMEPWPRAVNIGTTTFPTD